MKQEPHLQKAQENMKPGVISLEGFLGNDHRNLIDIILEDDAEVKRIEHSHQQIADALKYFRDLGKPGMGEFVSVQPHHEVQYESVRGKLTCPFEDGVFPKTAITVRNKKSGEQIVYSDIHIHMIEAHGFYEGKGFRFRLEPANVVGVLELDLLKEDPTIIPYKDET